MADKKNYIPAADLWQMVNAAISQVDAGVDKGVIGKDGATSIVKSNNIMLNYAGMYTQRIANGDVGNITDESLQHNIKTVRANISCSDLIVNNHKMNSYLYEITNMKKMQDTAIGNFTVMGTVLVKTYDPNLEKWVLIRRQVRVPMFSNVLNPYAIDERLSIPTAGDTIYSYKINKDDGDK